MIAFCQEHAIPHEICGKLVVASKLDEVPRLKSLFERGRLNGLTGLKMLDRSEMREIEPHVGGVAAIRVPEEGIVDFPAVCNTLARRITEKGGCVATLARVTKLEKSRGRWITKDNLGRL
jgi:L-2-hydroxyglutarate oxidase